MKTIQLGEKVVVSDPCYELPTWCQAVIENVLPGEYDCKVITKDMGMWGIRNTELIVTKSGLVPELLTWEETPFDIGVDSGQAGVFSFESYRNDNHIKEVQFINGKSPFDGGYVPKENEDGEGWYEKMCDLTLSTDESAGTYDQGVVTSSGIGDGSYVLYTASKEGKVVGFKVDFLLEDEEDEEDDWDDED
jgi:hypothetical protein